MSLGVLAGLLCVSIAYLAFGPGTAGRSPGSRACAPPMPPAVQLVGPAALAPLREAVARVLPQRVGRLYEEGTVLATDAWQDGDPSAPPVARSAARPAAYEMRWWAPNNDDIVADVFSFATTQRAARFLELAASPHCRSNGTALTAGAPPQARNLTWVNPDKVAEADLLMQRGRLVYRLADVPAGQLQGAQLDLSHALLTIDTLACLLPQARCRRGNSQGVPV